MPTGTCMPGAALGDQKPRGWQTEQAQSTARKLPCSTVGGTGQGQKDTWVSTCHLSAPNSPFRLPCERASGPLTYPPCHPNIELCEQREC